MYSVCSSLTWQLLTWLALQFARKPEAQKTVLEKCHTVSYWGCTSILFCQTNRYWVLLFPIIWTTVKKRGNKCLSYKTLKCREFTLVQFFFPNTIRKQVCIIVQSIHLQSWKSGFSMLPKLDITNLFAVNTSSPGCLAKEQRCDAEFLFSV